ncbi:hypothetical protein OEZ85_012442 [Tetradesmus obliquus]|uniref:RING-type domain-containing protein n=1 Tax=Tetradesmus obliquus TaxID=3088 RepID=A0ABY8TVU8_TETOB|nr:hypothetical protein OEZ85_012442 [Tetradesmus obliquus]
MGQQLTKSCPSHDRSLYKPQGVHKLENIDLRKLKKLIKARRIAPFWEQQDQDQDGREECPICNYWYPAINTASCCGARLCTECFVMCQSSHDPPGKAACPYCKKVPFSVRYLGCKTEEQMRRERMERQIVAEAKLRHMKEHALAGSQRQQQQQQQQSGTAGALGELPPHRTPQQQQQQQQVPSGHQLDQQQQTQQQQQPAEQQQQWIDQLEQQQPQQQPQQQQQQQAAELPEALFESQMLPQYVRRELAGLTAEELEEIMLEQALMASLQQAVAAEAAALVARQLPAWAPGAAAAAAAGAGTAATRAAAS